MKMGWILKIMYSFQGIEVSADFLKTIEEEKQPKHNNSAAAAPNSEPLKKKFPFNRTTTPNSLREALRETLVRNVENKDLSDTIQSIKDDEIRDVVCSRIRALLYDDPRYSRDPQVWLLKLRSLSSQIPKFRSLSLDLKFISLKA